MSASWIISPICCAAAYPVALKDGTHLKDGFVEVKFKALSGREDQAGGALWRAKDADNHYICRANALEDNVVLYKTVNGKRSSLPVVGRRGGYGVKEKVAPQTWHTLRVEFAGNRFAAIVLVTHSPFEALALGQRALVLEGRRVIESGDLRTLLASPRSNLLRLAARRLREAAYSG